MILFPAIDLKDGKCVRLKLGDMATATVYNTDPALKVPQIGWNTLRLKRQHPLFAGIPTGDKGLHAYFVHSYHLEATHAEDMLAVADYGGPVTAAVASGNMAGTQFHPEKSQALGLALIANFLRWKP